MLGTGPAGMEIAPGKSTGKLMENAMSSPLSGIRVLDLARVLAGPYCASLLAMLGAEVIKVEGPAGDETRAWPPDNGGLSTPFIALNLNKRGMVVDLKSEAGREVLKDLVREADVLVENFKVGTLEQMGLGYETLREVNPRLVYASITSYGRQGPRANDPGYEAVIQAYGGAMSMTGHPEGEPMRSGVSFVDMSTGITSALAVVTALFRRATTGQGCRVDASLLQTSLGLMSYHVASFLMNDVIPQPLGSAHPSVAPYQVFPVADGHIFIAAANQNLYERLCRALGREELIHDPRFADNPNRVKNRVELLETLFAETKGYQSMDLLTMLREAGVPASQVNNLAELMADGQVEAIGGLLEMDHPQDGPVRLAGMPFFLDGQGGLTGRQAPRLGEHTREILQELGYSAERIEELIARKVVHGP